MSAEAERLLNVEEYLSRERESAQRHEYWDGRAVAMAGASRAHGLICWNVANVLGPQIRRRGCEGYVSDMRVWIPASPRYVYPDVVVVCGEPAFEDAEVDTLVNPTLVVEVLSPSTEVKDRGLKLFAYRGIESLRVCLLVAQDRTWIEHWQRQDDGSWRVVEVTDSETAIDLPEIGASLPVAEVYAGVPGTQGTD
jgi:Uma2 family endonuclease